VKVTLEVIGDFGVEGSNDPLTSDSAEECKTTTFLKADVTRVEDELTGNPIDKQPRGFKRFKIQAA